MNKLQLQNIAWTSTSRENYSLWFLPFCPFALLPFCPFALLPSCPIALAPPLLSSSAKFGRLSNEGIFCSCFHISVHVQILSTLLMLLLPAQMTTMTFFSRRQFMSMLYLAANVEALSKHPKTWRRTRSRCRSSWDLRIWIAIAKYCLFWLLSVYRTRRSTRPNSWLT